MRDSQVELVVKKPPANAGGRRDAGSIPGSGRSPEEGAATYSQHPPENPKDRAAWLSLGSGRAGHDREAKTRTTAHTVVADSRDRKGPAGVLGCRATGKQAQRGSPPSACLAFLWDIQDLNLKAVDSDPAVFSLFSNKVFWGLWAVHFILIPQAPGGSSTGNTAYTAFLNIICKASG